MAKKKKDISIQAEIDQTKLTIDRKDENIDVVYDGKNKDIEYHKDNDNHQFKYDGKKLDVEVIKKEGEINVKIDAETGFLKFIGKLIAKVVGKRFKR